MIGRMNSALKGGVDAMNRSIRILHLEDSPRDAELIRRRLAAEDIACDTLRVGSRRGFEAALAAEAFDLILCDYNLPGYDGMSALTRVREQQPETPVIMISGTLNEDEAVACVKAGATDYVLKQRLQRLAPAVRRALREADERRGRVRAEEALRESRQRLELALDASDLASWDWNLATGEVRFSEHWWRMLGYPRGEIALRIEGWEQLTHPDDLARVKATLVAYFKGAAPVYETEYRMRAKSGEWRWIRTVGRVVERAAGGRALRMTGTHGDVTERKRTEQALRALVAAGERTSDEDFHAFVARRLAEVLELEFAFVSVLAGERRDSCRTQAWWADGRLADNVEYPLAGTPCAEAIGGRCAIFPSGVQQRFPADRTLAELGVSAYAAVPLLDAAGRAIGHLAVMSRRPLASPAHVENILRLFAAPVAAQIERRRDERQFQDLFEFSADGMLMSDQQGIVRLVNLEAERMFGYRREELIGRPVETLVPQAAQSSHMGYRTRFLESAAPRVMGRGMANLFGLRKDGSSFPVEISLSPLQIEGSTMVAAAVRDITLRRQQEEKIARLSRIHALLSEVNSMIVRTRDRHELFAQSCRIAVEHGGFRLACVGLLDAAGGRMRLAAKAGLEDGMAQDAWLTARDGGAPDGCLSAEQVLRGKLPAVCNDIGSDTRTAPWREEALRGGYRSMALFPLHAGERAIGIFALYAAETGLFDTEEMKLLTELAEDVSFTLDYIEKEERVNYLAYYDALTGLPNRSLLQERASQEMIHARRAGRLLAVLFVDLDRFKVVNDSLGHPAGDELLKAVASRLGASVREGDTVARVGGDEFIVLLTDLRQAGDVALVARKLMDGFRRPFAVNGRELFQSMSVGASVFPQDGDCFETLMQHADTAMFTAKQAGRNAFHFYAREMTAEARNRLALETDLRRALERGELELHFQPKVDLASGTVLGAEALARWRHPERGPVSPAVFIPLAEEAGLIMPLGAWVLRSACEQAVAWRREGFGALRVAVNVSAHQFLHGDLLAAVEAALAQTGARAEELELEVTESIVMADLERTLTLLRDIRRLGVTVSLDDFGTGYSSLAYLRQLPLDELKIDRSFLEGIAEDDQAAELVRLIVRIAHTLGLAVVAEGVETGRQADLLRQFGCDAIQGYLVARPAACPQFNAWLRGWRGLAADSRRG